ncbi:hypothetical protein H7097_04130 [Aeromicrobium sp.]|nr:hypothetical protein [Candidatus Saccharibacteria bacterium]
MAANERFNTDTEDVTRVLIQLRLNQGSVLATPGAYSPTSGEFTAATGVLLALRSAAEANPHIQLI